MNLILLFQDDFIDNTNVVRLSGRRLKHVVTVHRAAIGERLTVGLKNGSIGTGTLTRLDNKLLEMEVKLDAPPPPPSPINLVLALPRPKVVSRILLSASSMGIKKIWLINAKRVEKSYWQSPRLSEESIYNQLILGLEQAKDTVMPTLFKKPLFKPFVEDELPDIIKGTRAVVAHPNSKNQCPGAVDGATTLAIGPEGGFIPYEMDKLIECGFSPFHIGERILRVETVIPALTALLSFPNRIGGQAVF